MNAAAPGGTPPAADPVTINLLVPPCLGETLRRGPSFIFMIFMIRMRPPVHVCFYRVDYLISIGIHRRSVSASWLYGLVPEISKGIKKGQPGVINN
jgi:hypothetical protein